ncbi:type III-B CRISPR module RAMP protein Cmr4 [Aeribacillus pallidus]|uniref:Type III-B CRISPR module RAMP protein Cmr4 n=1 Tax=Aeribacillus pallidus TaxID=33936 RepID=A0A165YSK3_9BACI|nr:type III-B CRISPR module RAMP protein Cmr4 [Aeribacillus pallidus]KZN97404.1 type III-B CRISPR module RAMP protein Cmr4 [Aeribacillus pallidus]
MYSLVRPFLLHAITSVHAGSGSEIGLVDLPIQREKHTGFPKIESSSLKGALRYTIETPLNQDEKKKMKLEKLELIFGSNKKEQNNNDTQSSAIALSDARILMFPVKSMRGIFAWITCPQVLKRFNDEILLHKLNVEPLVVPEAKTVSSERLIVANDHIVLEEYNFSVKITDEAKTLVEQLSALVKKELYTELRDRIVVLEDDDFADFVKLSTEINARIKINQETGTVDNGALWYEENVPPETIFYSFLYIGQIRGNGVEGLKSAEDVEKFLVEEGHFPDVFQLGGNSTLGRGMLRRIWV